MVFWSNYVAFLYPDFLFAFNRRMYDFIDVLIGHRLLLLFLQVRKFEGKLSVEPLRKKGTTRSW